MLLNKIQKRKNVSHKENQVMNLLKVIKVDQV